MFYSLTFENETGQQIDLSKTANRFMFSKIDGLNPPAGTISTSSYAGMDGSYVNESLGRYLSVGICCNTGENYRKIDFEILAGTPATTPSIPRFKDTETKTYLTLCAIRIDAGATEIKVTDYRENTTYCGYVRCILGKCKVTDMMSQLAEITEQMKDYNITILQLTGKIDELTLKVDEMTGDVVSIGKCGENINFTLFSDGKLILKGTGAMFDYDNGSNASPFKDNPDIKSVIVSEGITSIGEYAFQYCNNLKTAVLPTTLKAIKRNSFMPHIDEYIVHQNLYGLKVVKEIFKLYAEGFSASEISEILAKKHGTEISYSTVTKMLKNEIYVGDRHIQKNAPLNYLTKKPDDTVSYDSYYIRDNHEGVVSRELWEKVQERINGPRRHRNSHFMYGTVYCEKCGFPMSRITVTLKGQKVPVWKCSQHIKSKELCPQGYIKEEELMENIRRQMRWNLFFPKAFAEKIQRVEVGEGVKITLK